MFKKIHLSHQCIVCPDFAKAAPCFEKRRRNRESAIKGLILPGILHSKCERMTIANSAPVSELSENADAKADEAFLPRRKRPGQLKPFPRGRERAHKSALGWFAASWRLRRTGMILRASPPPGEPLGISLHDACPLLTRMPTGRRERECKARTNCATGCATDFALCATSTR